MIRRVEDGFIVNINKPADWTSFDVVKKIRNIVQIKKVGHAGTLDPFATGVLLICIGKATKLVSKFMDLDKEYVAELVLGKTTDTLDVTGEVVEEAEIPEISDEDIFQVFQKYTGAIRQRVPDFSAAKVDGKRMYEMARNGEEIPEKYKPVKIYDLQLLHREADRIIFRTRCSRGTYVRTLGYDIAYELGTLGYLENLTRTKIGEYSISDALDIEEFESAWKKRFAL